MSAASAPGPTAAGVVVFDFDGLILDTEGPAFTAWQEVFAANGSELTIEEWSAEIGTVGGLDVMELLRGRATQPVDEHAVHERLRTRHHELIALEDLRPGVEAWIEEADAMGIPVAIASSSPAAWVHAHLDRFALRERFATIACYGDGLAAKPAPDLYLFACAALGVAPHDAIAVEDSPNGVRAAREAGLRCIAVPNAITEGLDLSHSDLRIASLVEMSLRDAVSVLASVDRTR